MEILAIFNLRGIKVYTIIIILYFKGRTPPTPHNFLWEVGEVEVHAQDIVRTSSLPPRPLGVNPAVGLNTEMLRVISLRQHK